MNTLDVIQDIENRAKAAKTTITELCKLAGIAPSTVNRWRAGTNSPTLGKLTKIEAALHGLETSCKEGGRQ